MEANKEEAEKCIALARGYIMSKDYERAKRLLLKSINMFPTPEAQSYLSDIDRLASQSPSAAARSPSPVRPRAAPSSPEPQAPSGATYTPEQVEIVRRVLSVKTDYYAILGLTKDAKEEQIKKAYRKLALSLHPDKNSAPGAEDAFKYVSTAFSCLSDPRKRQIYDVNGTEEISSGLGRRYGGGFNSGFEEVSPEDIFNMFFHGMSANQARNFGQRAQRPRHANGFNGQPAGVYSVLHLIPVLILVFAFFFLTPSVVEPTFQLERTHAYPIQRTTENRGIAYFVKRDFNIRDLGPLEHEVEMLAFKYLKSDCQRENERNQRAIYWGKDPSPTPACDKLCKLYDRCLHSRGAHG